MAKTPPEPADNEQAASVVSTRRSQVSRTSSRRPPQPNDADGDVRSDVQEGNQSEVARTIPINTTGYVSGLFSVVIRGMLTPRLQHEQEPDHEPGPNDPPHIRPGFESYTSSFGNFGPLRDSLPPANGWSGQVC